MEREFERADAIRRLLAHGIDSVGAGLLSWILALSIGPVSALLYAVFILFKDCFMYAFTKKADWRGQSIGKRLLGIRVVREDGNEVDWATSATRNITLVVASLGALVPFLGVVIVGLLAPIIVLIEIWLGVTDPLGKRIGDRLAATRVVVVED